MELLLGMFPFIIMIGLMYLLMIRPQQKRAKETQNMLGSLQKGDSIVTIGGLHGLVDEVNETNNTVVLDCEGIYLTFERRAVARIVTKATAAGTTQVEDLGSNSPDNTVNED